MTPYLSELLIDGEADSESQHHKRYQYQADAYDEQQSCNDGIHYIRCPDNRYAEVQDSIGNIGKVRFQSFRIGTVYVKYSSAVVLLRLFIGCQLFIVLIVHYDTGIGHHIRAKEGVLADTCIFKHQFRISYLQLYFITAFKVCPVENTACEISLSPGNALYYLVVLVEVIDLSVVDGERQTNTAEFIKLFAVAGKVIVMEYKLFLCAEVADIGLLREHIGDSIRVL